jgi:hypothetical protein
MVRYLLPGGLAVLMRTLSILQPWAWLIVNGHKDIENRRWRLDYRGRIVVHAGQKFGPEQRQDIEHVRRQFPEIQLPADIKSLGFGGIVGTVEIVDCVTSSPSPWFNGPYGFVLRDAKRCKFEPYRGQLGLFPVSASLVQEISET